MTAAGAAACTQRPSKAATLASPQRPRNDENWHPQRGVTEGLVCESIISVYSVYIDVIIMYNHTDTNLFCNTIIYIIL